MGKREARSPRQYTQPAVIIKQVYEVGGVRRMAAMGTERIGELNKCNSGRLCTPW